MIVNPYGYCQCGCGGRTNLAPQTRTDRGWVRGEPKRFLQNHHLRLDKSGDKHPRWRGGRRYYGRYVHVWVGRDHPMADAQGRCYEHRIVMALHLGRMLRSEEVVHHENEVKHDNRIENLRLFANVAEHSEYHQEKLKRLAA